VVDEGAYLTCLSMGRNAPETAVPVPR
jgi:hypothetical protein